MSPRTKLAIVLTAIAGLSFTAPTVSAQQGDPTITIENTGADPPYTFGPAQLDAKVGQPITVTNNDPNGDHSVTAEDRTFNVDVPPKSSVTFTVSKAGNYAYICVYHTDAHNPASLNVS
ncbi:MAG: cupredoxin domain-containing protein [Acidimicrobiia bacterium]